MHMLVAFAAFGFVSIATAAAQEYGEESPVVGTPFDPLDAELEADASDSGEIEHLEDSVADSLDDDGPPSPPPPPREEDDGCTLDTVDRDCERS